MVVCCRVWLCDRRVIARGGSGSILDGASSADCVRFGVPCGLVHVDRGAIFFTFVLAPALLQDVQSRTGAYARSCALSAIFPGRRNIGCCSHWRPSWLGPLCYHEYRGAMVGVQAMVIIGVIMLNLYGGNSLTPGIRTAGRDSAADFTQLERVRRRTAGLSFLILVIGLSLLAVHTARPIPKTWGFANWHRWSAHRYDAAINRVIEDTEIKYGFRPPRPAGTGLEPATDPLIDRETVRKVESYYARKRLRDRRGPGRLRERPATLTWRSLAKHGVIGLESC